MNRSEELCKLLGIEPKKEIAMHCGTNCSRHNCIMDRDCEHYKPIGAYPDLTKPSNFVKLLDLLNAYLDIRCDCLMAVVPQIIDKSIFLASTNSSRFIDKKDKFKKQAQATKWDY